MVLDYGRANCFLKLYKFVCNHEPHPPAFVRGGITENNGGVKLASLNFQISRYFILLITSAKSKFWSLKITIKATGSGMIE